MVLGSFSLKNHISPKYLYTKTPDRYVFSNCVKTVLVRNNSFTESIANILVPG